MGPSLARLYRLAADQGHAFGQNNLGHMYANGKGVAKDLVEVRCPFYFWNAQITALCGTQTRARGWGLRTRRS